MSLGCWRVSCSYLAGGDELQRPQGAAHVRDVGLELVDGIGDAGLNLAGVGARRRVGGDLVKGGGRHGCGVDGRGWRRRKKLLQMSKVVSISSVSCQVYASWKCTLVDLRGNKDASRHVI